VGAGPLVPPSPETRTSPCGPSAAQGAGLGAVHPRQERVHEGRMGRIRGWLPGETKLIGVQIADTRDELKLFRPSDYPVVRGTAMYVGDQRAYLWTSGYAPRLDTYMGPETPNPISVRLLRGDCDLDTVLNDVLGLTKINFNSCLHNDRLPVTIRFANAVGDVLVATPMDGDPKLPFKFYI
jgi:hypothetical protein